MTKEKEKKENKGRNRKPKDRFEAGMTKEQWEDLMEKIYPVNKLCQEKKEV